MVFATVNAPQVGIWHRHEMLQRLKAFAESEGADSDPIVDANRDSAALIDDWNEREWP